MWSPWADSSRTPVTGTWGILRMGWYALEQVNVAAVHIALLCWELCALQTQKDVRVSCKVPQGLPIPALHQVWEGPGLFLPFPFAPAVQQYPPLHQHCCFPAMFPFCPLSLLSKQQFPSLWQCPQCFLLWQSELSQEISFSGMQPKVKPSLFYFELRLELARNPFAEKGSKEKSFQNMWEILMWKRYWLLKHTFTEFFSFLWLETSDPFLSPKVIFYKELLL